MSACRLCLTLAALGRLELCADCLVCGFPDAIVEPVGIGARRNHAEKVCWPLENSGGYLFADTQSRWG
jgi:hypothetical protein